VAWSITVISAKPGWATSDALMVAVSWPEEYEFVDRVVGRTEPFHRTAQVEAGVVAAESARATLKLKAGAPACTELGVTLKVSPLCPFKAQDMQATINSRAKNMVS
jgi:hypothetical protein